MKYDHAVMYEGNFYPTGAEVPVEVEKTLEELEADIKAKEEADKLEADKLVENESQVKVVKSMHRDELNAFAPTVGVVVEDKDNVETLKAKIIATIQ